MTYELEWYAETADGRPVHDTPAYSLNATSRRAPTCARWRYGWPRTASRSSSSTLSTRRGRWRCRWGRPIRWRRPTTASPRAMRSAPPGPPPAFGPHLAPLALADGLGNGCHLHFSLWRDGRNLLGVDPDARASASPARAAPSWPGCCANAGRWRGWPAPARCPYRRLAPSRWTGAYVCWGGADPRGAAALHPRLRGRPAPTRANAELKLLDSLGQPLPDGGRRDRGRSGRPGRRHRPSRAGADRAVAGGREAGAGAAAGASSTPAPTRCGLVAAASGAGRVAARHDRGHSQG